jgi:tetratricopeptide (TPR) repeat protein
MLEGTAALAKFRGSPKPEWNLRALDASQRAMALADPKSASEWEAWTDAAVSTASVLHDLARYAEAEPLLRDCQRLRESKTGPNSPGVAVVLNNLAELLRATNRLAEAEPLYRRALAIDEQSYGPDHPKVATRLNNLALLLEATNRLAEAEPLMARAVRIYSRFQRLTDHEHPNLRVAMRNYRGFLTAQKLAEPEIAARIKTASEGTEKLAPIVPEVVRLLGPAKPVADVLSSLDRQYKEQGRPTVYFLGPKEPIAPHLDELLGKPSK